jgi:hypothetical protein
MPTESKKKVFISYAREDIVFDPWFDKESLLLGDEWRIAIVTAIKKCDYFLALLSSNSVQKSGFVQKELREALSALEELPEGKK